MNTRKYINNLHTVIDLDSVNEWWAGAVSC